jgi:hypothetical protein
LEIISLETSLASPAITSPQPQAQAEKTGGQNPRMLTFASDRDRGGVRRQTKSPKLVLGVRLWICGLLEGWTQASRRDARPRHHEAAQSEQCRGDQDGGRERQDPREADLLDRVPWTPDRFAHIVPAIPEERK